MFGGGFFSSHYFTPTYFNGAGIIFIALMELHLAGRSNWLSLDSRSADLTLLTRSNGLTLPEH